jgi:hypothetical protein
MDGCCSTRDVIHESARIRWPCGVVWRPRFRSTWPRTTTWLAGWLHWGSVRVMSDMWWFRTSTWITPGGQFFPGSTIHVQTAEMRHAMYPDRISAAGFVRTDFDRSELRYELAEGDFEVVPGVWAIFPPGHTPGHQSLLVQLPSRAILVTGDAAYEHRQIERCIPPPVASDDAEAVYSLKRIRGMQLRDGVHVIVSHDADAWSSLELGPACWYS